MVELAIVLAKAVHSAGAAVLFGALLFTIYARRETEGLNLRPLFALAVVAAWAGSLILLFSQTANMAGDAGAAFDPALLSAAFDTYFGKVWLARLAILGVLTVLIFARTSPRVRLGQAVASSALVASLALQGHPGAALAEGNVIPLLSDAAHALAAGAWVGALCVLVVMVIGQENTRAQKVSAALTRFSIIGPAIVGMLVLSGVVNLWLLSGAQGQASLLRSSYGAVLGVKMLFFVGMLALAAAHRYALAPKLAHQIASGENAPIVNLRISIFAEAGLGALVLSAAAMLGSTPPVDG